MMEKRKDKNYHELNPVTPPGITILENIKALNMNQIDLAGRMGRPLKTINEIIKGKTVITSETALQLEHVIGIPASFWLTREARYREYLERKRELRLLEEAPDWIQTFPLKKMIEFGWIRKFEDVVSQANELLNFFGIAKPNLWTQILQPYAAYRKSEKCAIDEGTLAVWLRKGEIESKTLKCNTFNEKRFKTALNEIQKLTQEEPVEFVPKIQELCANAGVVVAFIREIPGTRAFGVARWLNSEKALMQLSSRYKTDDYFWFTFFHEAGHILNDGKRDSFLECTDNEGERENHANKFAANFLIEPKSYAWLLKEIKNKKEFISAELIRDTAQKIKVAPGIIVGRLQHDDKLPHQNLNRLKRTYDWSTLMK